ncbi:MAG: biotin--[acetyl-CoA-carboxylase] ligase [Candidatus Zipacnadales bacterium]
MTASLGGHVIRLAEVSSTIEVARELARKGAGHGTVVRAEHQTAGRGRRGRSWTTLPGKSLAITIILRDLPSREWISLAGMAGGLAFLRSAESIGGTKLQTKWPNDVVMGDRKIAGTLAELSGGVLLLSIGANVGGSETELPLEIRTTATTLERVAGRPIDGEQLFDRLLAELAALWETLLRTPEKILAEWTHRDLVIGGEVRVLYDGGRAVEGRALGIDNLGRLRLQRQSGEVQMVSAGEVCLRPVTTGRLCHTTDDPVT